MGLAAAGALTRARCGLLAGLLLAAGIATHLRVADAQGRQYSPEEIQRGRQQALQEILNGPSPGAARLIRHGCAFNDRIAGAAKARAAGEAVVPHPGDVCIAALTRQARDGALMALYQDIIAEQRPDAGPGSTGELVGRLEGMLQAQRGGHDPEAEALPQKVIAAIQNGNNQVELGVEQKLAITPGLAMDIGFVAAYWAGNAARPPTVSDRVKFAQMTESCVGQRGDIKLCFTVGYVHGAAAR